jgi:hypothetical protein
MIENIKPARAFDPGINIDEYLNLEGNMHSVSNTRGSAATVAPIKIGRESG